VADGSLLNYESASSYRITVQVTDAGGLTRDQSFTIALTNVNEVPICQDVPASLVQVSPTFGGKSGTGSSLSPGTAGESDRNGFRPPEDLRRSIEITTEPPLVVETLLSGRTSQQSAEEDSFKGAPSFSRERESRDLSQGHKERTEKQREGAKALSIPITLPDHGEQEQRDQPVEAKDESPALGMTLALGLAGAVLQGTTGSKETITALTSQSRARTQGAPPGEESEETSMDGHATPANESEHSHLDQDKPRPSQDCCCEPTPDGLPGKFLPRPLDDPSMSG
jgi:hypothetical protein